MKINIETSITYQNGCVGNVYSIRGGSGARLGHMQVLIAITKANDGLFIVINSDGDLIGVNKYGMHVVNDWAPVAFVNGIADLELVMVSL